MTILDENIPKSQRELLSRWRIRAHQIGFDVGREGMQDDELIPFLLEQRRPTFVSRDEDFYNRHLCHARYALVFMAVDKYEVAVFARRVLRHSALDTQAKRMGKAIRVSSAGLSFWTRHAIREVRLEWE